MTTKMPDWAHKTDDGIAVIDKEKTDYKKPPMFNVVLINDDYTTMPFVTGVLTDIFGKNMEQAIRIMLDVHNNGKGVAGTYARDVAETKMQQTLDRARREEHPLQIKVEPV